MSGASLPPDEPARLFDLARTSILDSAAEASFDRIVRLAARLLNVPMAAINFIDVDRQWAKAAVGLSRGDTPREQAFCAWTIRQDAPLVVPDATQDPRFTSNPLVLGEPGIRLYAGVPLTTAGGHRIGALCIVDQAPRDVSEEALETLQDLAALTVDVLEARQLRLMNTANEVEDERYVQAVQAVQGAVEADSVVEAGVAALRVVGETLDVDWVGLVQFGAGVVRVHSAHVPADLDVEVSRLEAYLRAADDVFTQALPTLADAQYVDEYALQPLAAPFPLQAEVRVQGAAWVPVGAVHGSTYLLVALRFARRAWTLNERALLELTARQVRAAFARPRP
ncbi:GAF domain-containing protein [Deinococcus maricopensis]|uniref:GAF domain protein n=1 Tax=Deinococcus maricopensis (strain DSM 21211 / LMG 22137 / NRRL B-23946 / LB-34) TaxID=709986 RepID=E8U983_DEIML|nr:GAF domain-containing protein [Deinococcus maricopensis]ADV67622.1 GAF domain protein [Deinococcus maricopensis DSM 21211]